MTTNSITHREGCRAGATWLLRQRWCQIAAWEMAGPEVEAQAGKKGTQLDAVGWSSPSPEVKTPRMVVIEVKVSRHDLLADLRASKMLAYEKIPGVSGCYVAAPDEVFEAMNSDKAFMLEARLCGIPLHWGLMRLVRLPDGDVEAVMVRASSMKGGPTVDQRIAWTTDAARSLAYRALRRDGPEAER